MWVAHAAHTHRRPLIGWHSDIDTTTIKDTEAFYRRYYTNENFTFAIVGDVDAGRMRELAETYFGSIEPTGTAPSVTTKEPPDRKSTRLNSSHVAISYAVFCLKKKKT